MFFFNEFISYDPPRQAAIKENTDNEFLFLLFLKLAVVAQWMANSQTNWNYTLYKYTVCWPFDSLIHF